MIKIMIMIVVMKIKKRIVKVKRKISKSQKMILFRKIFKKFSNLKK